MAEKRICMGCMRELEDGLAKCPHCGYPAGGVNPAQFLQVRSILSEHYLIGRVTELGGDSALYIGYDRIQRGVVMIREFLPDMLCTRSTDGALLPKEGCEIVFDDLKKKFHEHAKMMAHLRTLPGVMPLYDIFEENNTIYTVSEQILGTTLEQVVKENGGRMSWEQLRPLFVPLLNAVQAIHEAGMHHYGICPRNILIDSEGKPVLRNFLIAEARRNSNELKSGLLTGYSAPEQYDLEAQLDEKTDVYGLTATLFYVLTGMILTDGASRARGNADLLMPAGVAGELPAHVKSALFRGLQVDHDKRLDSVSALRDLLTAAPVKAALLQEEEEEEEELEEEEEEEERAKESKGMGKGKIALIFAGVVLVLLIFCGVFLQASGIVNLTGWLPFGKTTTTQSTRATAATSTSTTHASYKQKYKIPDVRGKLWYNPGTFEGDISLKVIGKAYSEKAPGTILSQSITAGTEATGQTTMEVTVSCGPMERTMVDVSGWEADKAKLYLEALGYVVNPVTLEVTESKYDRGLVDHTDPAVNAKVSEGSTITLYVSAVAEETTTTTGSDGSSYTY